MSNTFMPIADECRKPQGILHCLESGHPGAGK